MKKVGVSSSCYYPLTTEQSFEKICAAGISCAEIFFNAPSELNSDFIKQLLQMKRNAETEITALHPFMSFAESFFLFSSYERRFFDMLDFYKRFFEAAVELNAKFFVIHGAKLPCPIEDEIIFERFARLTEEGKKYGVQVCQENVVHHRSESPDFLYRMKKYIGGDFGVVLDIKQSKRAAFSPFEFIDLLGDSIKHIHISDYNSDKDCITPLKGDFRFKEFFTKMDKIHYDGAFIIELYNHSYEDENEIIDAYNKISKLLVE